MTTVTGVEVGFVLLTERNALPAFVEELTRGERYRPLGRVSSIAGAVEIARSRAADVVVVDVVSAERLNRVVAFVRDMAPAKVVLVSGLPPEAALLTAMTAGVRGFLRKPVPAGLLAQAVDAVVAGQTFVDPRSTQWLVELALHGHRSRPWSGLTFRQSQVVELARGGLSNREIGRALGLSRETVKSHLHEAMRRLGVSDRHSASLLADRLREEQ